MTQEHPVAKALQAIVDSGELAGAVALSWRAGGEVRAACVGWRDREAGAPMARDTIFRIASMTKPVTSAAALALWEEGRFALDDPVSRFAPELAELRVLRSPGGPLGDTVPARRPITFEDLLTHRSGLTYADFEPGPLGEAYLRALGGEIDSHVAPDDWIAGLATLPLVDQPGAAFHYGVSADLLGLLLARMEGAPLGDVLARRVFGPLGMRDTGFTVPREKRARRAAQAGFDAAGRLTTLAQVPGGHALPERPDDMAFESGGQGLWSTADDYMAFARLFAGGGAVDGARVLRPETVAMMAANRLTPEQRAASRMMGAPIFAAGHGFGLGVAVVMEPSLASPLICGGGAGAVGWPGAYGGWWQADPGDGSALVFLTHLMREQAQMAAGVGFGAWEAVLQFQALAAAGR